MAQQTVTTSKRFNLTLSDWTRGLLVAVLSPVITILIQSLDAGSLTFNWKAIITTGLSAGLAYVMKNWLLTPNEITIKNPPADQVQAVKDGEATAKVVSK